MGGQQTGVLLIDPTSPLGRPLQARPLRHLCTVQKKERKNEIHSILQHFMWQNGLKNNLTKVHQVSIGRCSLVWTCFRVKCSFLDTFYILQPYIWILSSSLQSLGIPLVDDRGYSTFLEPFAAKPISRPTFEPRIWVLFLVKIEPMIIDPRFTPWSIDSSNVALMSRSWSFKVHHRLSGFNIQEGHFCEMKSLYSSKKFLMSVVSYGMWGAGSDRGVPFLS